MYHILFILKQHSCFCFQERVPPACCHSQLASENIGLPGLGTEPSQSLCLHKTAQHRKSQTCIPDLCRIWNRYPGGQVTGHSMRHRPRDRRVVVITIKTSVSGLRNCNNRSTPAETSFWYEVLLYPYHTGATISTIQWTLFLVREITATTTHYWSIFLVTGTAV